jgi:cytochrome c peroxidase
VAFLFTLTDVRFAAENQQQFERQQTLAKEKRPVRDEALALRRTLPFEQRVMGSKKTDQ